MPTFSHLPLPSGPDRFRRWRRPHGSALALLLAETAARHDGVLLAVTRDTHGAHLLEEDLRLFAPEHLDVLHFPDWETLPYDAFAPHPDIVSQRIATLFRLPGVRRGVLIVPVATLLTRLAPQRFIGGTGLKLEVGQKLDLEAERRRLEGAGYRCLPQVMDPGEFAVRGALLDVFPSGALRPFRIELLDDEIDSIRSFDPDTQRSIDKVERIDLLPAREFPTDESALRNARNALLDRFAVDIRHSTLYQDLKSGTVPAGLEYYLPLFFERTETLFDYLGGAPLVLVEDGAFDAATTFLDQAARRYDDRKDDSSRPVFPVAELYLGVDALRESLNRGRRIELSNEATASDTGTAAAPQVPLGEDAGVRMRTLLEATPLRLLVAAESPGRREALLERWRESDLHAEIVEDWQAFHSGNMRLAVVVAPIEAGFTLPTESIAVLAERELLGERAPARRQRRRVGRDPDTIIRDLTELNLGAPVVHEDHGVGRYRGLTTLDVGGAAAEFLTIEYADGDKLYVPVAQLELVSRYSGASPEAAPLHRLGGEQWERAKRRAAEKVRDVAAELLAIQAQREAHPGTPLRVDRALLAQFAAGFPFEETPDQQNAIEAVIADLESVRPMDRVVCGDVGFGKTEVALRAAFAAASAGAQVAVLVPTTLLAQQHFQNFRDRLADWPLRVEVLSRFRSKGETGGVLADVEAGKVDIVIGTHRLLQGDLAFKRLGLVIVDEEQRFGVRQKERLKALRAEVNLLTLTATPIPRTLNMAMSGLRDLSLIATPPPNRIAVKTFVTQWEPGLLREAFQRELQRGGQVFFLHNEVESIVRMQRELEVLAPDARIRIAHGQMPERELEQVMLDFYRQRFNVLLCTTIIESGIDIPSANTIIIHRADRFGLAQLHQLRGRVGRSHHRAYAYLVVPDRRSMTADAAKRIEAIASLEELGAGFTLATHDLEIRGAGELLGEEQSGQIQEIGFSLYTELIERAVRALKSGKVADFDLLGGGERCEVELHLPALIPDDYLPDVHTRLVLYKRIASARDETALRELQVEMIDRFGLLPDPVKHLFAVARIKQRASTLGIRKLELGESAGRILFHAQPTIDPARVIRLLQAHPRMYAMDGPDKLRIKGGHPERLTRLRAAETLLGELGG
ncbi:MAG TPA: transcription-repair coupling factor [Xanthomonadaceae bacterium]|nr:transcription-repair coupling factor [Xanthomonadaceae bacterium]